MAPQLWHVNPMEMARIKLRWTGFNGAPGYSIFHFRDFEDGTGVTQAIAEGARARVGEFAEGIKTLIPNGVTLTVESDVEVIESSDGSLVNVLNGGTAATVNSTGPFGVAYAAPAGAVISWRTAGVHRGRRIKGRTFVLPLHNNNYETNGTLSPSTITALSAAAAQMYDVGVAGVLGIYARPHRTKNPDGTTTVTNDGTWAFVSSHSIPDMAAVLRSRRD